MRVFELKTPIKSEDLRNLQVGDRILASGEIICGRDAVLPKVIKLLEDGGELPISLEGQVIFHTAVSPAGIGPTSSNKLEIEQSMAPLSAAGVRLYLGKGELKAETVKILNELGAAYAVVPPVTALLEDRILERKCIAFPELGMEALYLIKAEGIPAIVAAVNGRSIYEK